ncbi:hypothetical protein F53441_3158 [Fusarium austroafricanum]|uniref:Uncharacterized protein n=1 Tax=Fusarium austroafricanum TaxID=2364996 RepID=A0A8H4KNE6_9HYPO|nr:hypothetical protein F53441_3158 [Fusarium austroafricanum]
MASDKKIRSRMARTTISTDPTTDDPFDEMCSTPSLSRKDYSEENGSGSKFAEAMNNPDWRHRRDGCSACESAATTSNTNHIGLRSHVNPQTTEEKATAFSYTKNTSICPWDCVDSANHLRSRSCSSEIGLKDTNGTPANKGYARLEQANAQKTKSKCISDKTCGPWTVLLDTDLANGPYKDRQFRVIQVTLLPPEYGDSNEHGRSIMGIVDRDFPVAHIQRVVGRPTRTKQEAENSSEDNCPTPHDRSSNQPRKEKDTITSKPEEKRIERAKEAIFKDPAVGDISSGHVSSQFKTTKDSALPADQARKDKELEHRNAAFMRILQKLQQGSKKETRNTKEDSLRNSSLCHDYPWGSKPSQQSHSSTGQRKLDGSDFTTGSLYDPRKSNESSHDSGICIDAEVLTRGLNPRAREFLSFKKTFTEIPQSCDIANLSDEAFLKRTDLELSSMEEDNATENSRGTGSVYLNHSIPTITSDFGVKKMESTSNPGATPVPSTKQDLGAFNYPLRMLSSTGLGLPFGTCHPSMQSILTPGLLPSLGLSGAIGYLPTPATFGSQLNQPITNPFLQEYAIASGPFMGNAAASPMPFNSMTGGGCYSSRPPPVSKPTDPDTTQQQKYEEYIEWRKANEPGYALACKNRQQRRAQRGITQQTVP